MSIGFLQATLEPHLRQFELSPVVLGLMFVINGGTYATTAPVWGWFCDKRIRPKVRRKTVQGGHYILNVKFPDSLNTNMHLTSCRLFGY